MKQIKIDKSSVFDLLKIGKSIFSYEKNTYNIRVSDNSESDIFIFGKKGTIIISKAMVIDLLSNKETSCKSYKLVL